MKKLGCSLVVVLGLSLAGCGEPVVDISSEERFDASMDAMYDRLPESDQTAFVDGVISIEGSVPQDATHLSDAWLERRRAAFRGMTAADLVRIGREAEAGRQAEEARKPYRFVGDESQLVASVVGTDYLADRKMLVDRELSVYVLVAVDGSAALDVRIDGARREASVQAPLEPEYIESLTGLFAKGVEWAGIAKSQGADVDKGLGCFGVDRGLKEMCDESGLSMLEGLVGVRFWSNGLGEKVHYSLSGVGPDFERCEVTLTAAQWRGFSEQLAGIDAAVAAALERLGNRELFQ